MPLAIKRILGPIKRILGSIKRTLGPIIRTLGTTKQTLGTTKRTLGTIKRTLGNTNERLMQSSKLLEKTRRLLHGFSVSLFLVSRCKTRFSGVKRKVFVRLERKAFTGILSFFLILWLNNIKGVAMKGRELGLENKVIKQVNLTVGFFAVTIGWTMMSLLYSIYLGWTHGMAHESGVIIAWSGIFVYLGWAIFLILPLNLLDHSKPIFKRHIFPFITGLYGAITYVILVGGLFRSWSLVIMFLQLPILVGLIFGFTYSTIIHNEKLINLLIKKPAYKLLSFISPAIILAFFLLLLPTIFPSLVFRYMPDEIQEHIFVREISKFKVGDNFKNLENAVPGYFNDKGGIINGNGGYYGYGPFIDYKLEVKNDTIMELELTIK